MSKNSEVRLTLILDDKGVVTGIKTAGGAVSDFARKGKQAGDDVSEAFKTLNIKSSKEVDELKAKASAAFETIRESGTTSAEDVSRAETALRNEMKNLNAELESTGRRTDVVSKHFGVLVENVAKYAIAYMGVYAAIDKVKGVISETADFQSALTDMAKVTSEDLGTIRKKILDMDPALGGSTEMMKAYYQTISAGVTDPLRAMQTMTVAAEAAKAAHIQQDEVIKGLTKTMAGYEGQIKNVSDASDLLFTIEKEGQTSFQELIPVVGGLAKISHDLGISADDMGASLATISQTAGSTAEAATYYDAVLVGLMKPTTQLTALFKRQGYESAQAAIKQLGFVGTLEMLKDSTGGSAQKMGQLLGRQEALLGMSALASNNFQTLTDKIEAMGNKTGATERNFEDWRQTFEGTWETFKNTWGKFEIEIGSQVLPGLTKILNYLMKINEEMIKTSTTSNLQVLNAAIAHQKQVIQQQSQGWQGAILSGLGLVSDDDITRMKKNLADLIKERDALLNAANAASVNLGNLDVTTVSTRQHLAQMADTLTYTVKGMKDLSGGSENADDAIKKLNESIQKQIDKLTLSQADQIKKQAAEWLAAGADKVKVSQWVHDQLIKLEQDRVNKINAIIKENDDWDTSERHKQVLKIAAGYKQEESDYQKFLDLKAKMTGTELDREIQKQKDDYTKTADLLNEYYNNGVITFQQYQDAMVSANEYTQKKISDAIIKYSDNSQDSFKEMGDTFDGVMNSMVNSLNNFLSVFGVQLPSAVSQFIRSMDSLNGLQGFSPFASVGSTVEGASKLFSQGWNYTLFGGPSSGGTIYSSGYVVADNGLVYDQNGMPLDHTPANIGEPVGSVQSPGSSAPFTVGNALTAAGGAYGVYQGITTRNPLEAGFSGAMTASAFTGNPIIIAAAAVASAIASLFGGKERPPAMNFAWKADQSGIGEGWSGVQVPTSVGNMEIVGQHGAPSDSQTLTQVADSFISTANSVSDAFKQLGVDTIKFDKTWSEYVPDMSGWSSDQIQQEFTKLLGDFVTAELPPEVTDKIKQFQDSGETFVDTLSRILGALQNIKNFQDTDFQSLFSQIDITPDTAKQAVDKISANINDALATLPTLTGKSLGDELTAVSDLITQRVQASVQYVTYIKQMMASVDDSIQAQIEKYTMAGMTETQKLMYYYNQSVNTWNKLQTETDPTKIGNLTTALQGDLDGLYNSLMTLKQGVDSLKQSAQSTWESMNLEMMPNDQARIDYINQQFQQIYSQYETAKKAGDIETMTTLGNQLISLANQGWNISGVDKQKSWAELSPVLQEVETDMSKASQNINDVIKDQLVPALTDLDGAVTGKLTDAINAEAQAIDDLKKQIGEIDWKPIIGVDVNMNGTDMSATATYQSLAVGKDYIPYDGFKASLHEGEAVVTSGGNKGIAMMASALTALVNKIDALAGDGKPVNIYLSADLAPLVSVASDAGANKAINIIRRRPDLIGASA